MTAWETAACLSHNPELWFANEQDATRRGEAVRICGDCPLMATCLAGALERERGLGADGRYGIFGGLTGHQRSTLAHRRPGGGPRPQRHPCGTPAAHVRHQAAGESCAVCLEASRVYARERAAKAKARGWVRKSRAAA